MVLDAGSRRLVDSVVNEDDILKENVTSRSQEENTWVGRRLSKGQT